MRLMENISLKEYQRKTKETIINTIQNNDKLVPYLGLIGEIGSIISELKKKLRDGKNYTNYEEKLKEELGDLLWYLSTIASQNSLELDDIAHFNLKKTKDRYLENNKIVDYDEGFPDEQKFPNQFVVDFIEADKKLCILDIDSRKQIGSFLTDNSYIEDNYRYHDIFHFGYVAHLGWSPVVRSMLSKKRKENEKIDEIEDGARAQIIDELITLYVFNYARDHNFLKDITRIDTEILSTIKKFSSQIEIKTCSANQWEKAIINSYQIFNCLVKNKGGKVLVSKEKRKLFYQGKN